MDNQTQVVALHTRSVSDEIPFERVLLGAIVLLVSGAFTLQLSGIDPADPTSLARVANGSIVMQLSMAVSDGFLLIILIRTPALGALLRGAWPILLLPALALLSTFWSVDPYLSFRKAVAFSGETMLGLALVGGRCFDELMRLLVRTMSAGVLLSIVWVFAVPTLGVHQPTDVWPYYGEGNLGAWRGVFVHKNVLGYFSALTFALLYAYGGWAFPGRLVRLLAMGSALLCLFGSRSGGGLIIAVIALISLLLARFVGRIQGDRRAGIAVLLGACLVITVILVGYSFDQFLWLLGKDAGITGRVPFWNMILEGSANISAFGYGYVAGFTEYIGPIVSVLVNNHLVNSHNGYIEVLVTLGYVGGFSVVFVMIWYLWRSIHILLTALDASAAAAAFPLAILLCVTISNIVESMLTATGEIEVVLFVTGAGVIARCRESLSPRLFSES